jgi:hypothetical protein
MNDYNNGEIWGWNGGECPVHPESEVMVWYRGNTSSAGFRAKSHSWSHPWRHSNSDGDIVCFQVTKVHVEPKVIYVNEYKADDAWHGFLNEEQAKRYALRGVTRIGVKYVEEMK